MKLKPLCLLVICAFTASSSAFADKDDDYLEMVQKYLAKEKARWDCPDAQDVWTHEPERTGSEADRTGSRVSKCVVIPKAIDIGKGLHEVQKGLMDSSITNAESLVRPIFPTALDSIMGVGQQFLIRYTRNPDSYVVLDTTLEIATNEKDRLIYHRIGINVDGKGLSGYVKRITGHMDMTMTRSGEFEAVFDNSTLLDYPWGIPGALVKRATRETMQNGRDKILYMILKNM